MKIVDHTHINTNHQVQSVPATRNTSSGASGATNRSIKAIVVALGLLSFMAAPSVSAGQRPISDFLQSQVPYPETSPWFPFLHPVWPDLNGNIISVDYAGLDNAYWNLGLPTSFDGSINERALPDGTAEVSVVLHTRNALTFAFSVVSGSFPDFPLLIGNYPWATSDSTSLAVGHCTLQIKFINPGGLGAPLPDYFQLAFFPAPGQKLLFEGFVAQATGPLPDGTSGFVQTRQTGLLATSQIANPNSRVAFDAYPAEEVTIQPIGK